MQPQFVQNFKATGDTVTLTAGATTDNVEITESQQSNACLVFNSHTAIVFIRFGGESVEAAATDIPIPPNGWVVLHKGNAGYVAGLAASTSGDVYFTPGIGS